MSKKEIVLILFLGLIAGVRYVFFIPKAPSFGDIIGKEVLVKGEISEDPDVRLNNQQLKIKILNQRAYLLVITNRSKEYKYGDIIEVIGKLDVPENFITDQGKEFNYKKYLANQDIYFLLKYPSIEILSRGNGNYIYAILYKIKNSFVKSINKTISPPESSLAGGLILGLRGGFDEEMRNNLIETGTIHIVALSGYNVSVVVDNVMKMFGKIFSENISTMAGIITVLLFVIMTGGEVTAIRAGIMAVIMLVGRMTGRRYLAGRALIITAFLMITYDPRVLTDLSFILSFVATVGVLFLTPKIFKYFNFLPVRFGIREMVASTLSATIFVLPTILYSTGVFSLVSIFANLLILLFIPYAMLFTFLTGLVGLVSSAMAIPFGFLSHLVLHYILYVIKLFGSFSYSSVIISSFPLVFVLVSYLFLCFWIFNKKE